MELSVFSFSARLILVQLLNGPLPRPLSSLNHNPHTRINIRINSSLRIQDLPILCRNQQVLEALTSVASNRSIQEPSVLLTPLSTPMQLRWKRVLTPKGLRLTEEPIRVLVLGLIENLVLVLDRRHLADGTPSATTTTLIGTSAEVKEHQPEETHTAENDPTHLYHELEALQGPFRLLGLVLVVADIPFAKDRLLGEQLTTIMWNLSRSNLILWG